MPSVIKLERQHHFITDGIVIPLVASWCLVAQIFLYFHGIQNFVKLSFVNEIQSHLFFITVVFVYLMLLACYFFRRNTRIIAFVMLLTVSSYAAMLIGANNDVAFFAGILAVSLLIGYLVFSRDRMRLSSLYFSERSASRLIIIMSGLFVLFVGGLTTLRYLNFATSTYDFGIFSQMFYYMKETLLPMTTSERNILLSHYAIHISPIFYLLLPGYFIFPSPVYLQVMQSLILASGVIPLRMICRETHLSTKVTTSICMLYLAYPALIGGAFYDIHENKFLTPLILWLFYFLVRDSVKGIITFSILILAVKEDAALYVFFIGLYMVLSRRRPKLGLFLSVLSLCWFAISLLLLKHFGQGAMTDRFSNFMSDREWGLASIFRTIILNPGYAFKEILSAEKLKFILLMLIPIGFIPLLRRDLKQIVLLIPFIVMNLMSNYTYQHSIYFQYTYGSIAMFFFLTVINIKEMKPPLRQNMLCLALMGSLIIGLSHLSGFLDLGVNAIKNHDDYAKIREQLSMIPTTASVEASGFYLPSLSQRKIIYDQRYNRKAEKPHDTEYVVLDLRPGNESNMEQTIQFYKSRGYLQIAYEPDLIAIFQNPAQ